MACAKRALGGACRLTQNSLLPLYLIPYMGQCKGLTQGCVKKGRAPEKAFGGACRGAQGSLTSLNFVNLHTNFLRGSVPQSWGTSFHISKLYLLGFGGVPCTTSIPCNSDIVVNVHA